MINFLVRQVTHAGRLALGGANLDPDRTNGAAAFFGFLDAQFFDGLDEQVGRKYSAVAKLDPGQTA